MKNKKESKGRKESIIQQTIPKLRFKEFRNEEEWEEKLLSNTSPSIFDGTHQTPTYTTEGIPFYSVENLISGNKNKFISREDYALATSKNKPEKGDILLTRIGKIGFSKVVDWNHEFSIYVTLAVIKQSASFNSNYLHYYFQSSRYQKELHGKSLLNAVPCKINMDMLRSTKCLLPKLPEQQKIADCLFSLDELISANNQKLDKLKTYKKGLMQNLFPAEGETVPKLRFREFKNAGEWEDKQLKYICEMQAGKFISASEIFEKQNDSMYPCYGGNGLRGFTKSYTHNGTYPLIGRQGALCGNITFAVNKFHATEHAVVATPKVNVNVNWLYYKLIHLNLNQYAIGQAQPGLSVENLEKLTTTIPLEIKEQQKVADCLSSIDEEISKQVQKIESLKTHKKGLMQQLFPIAEEGN